MQFCSFDPCSSSSSSMQVSSTATAAAASDNLGKLQISTHDRRIAFFFNPPLLFSAPLLYAMHFYRNLAYMPKSQRISDNQCTLSTLPLFGRKFKNTNEVICSNKNLRNRRRSQQQAAWQLTAAEKSEIGKATFIMHAYNLFTQLCNWMSVPFMVSSEFPMKPLL